MNQNVFSKLEKKISLTLKAREILCYTRIDPTEYMSSVKYPENGNR